MPVYQEATQLYSCLQDLFTRVELENPQAVEVMLRAGLQFRFRCSAPEAEFVIDSRKRPLRYLYGANNVRPDVDVALATDTLHRILLGELTITKAIGRKLLHPKGPIWKTTALLELFRQAKTIYPKVLREHGLG